MSNKANKKEMSLNDKLNYAIELVDKADSIEIDGNRYTKVNERVKILRKVFGFDIKVSNILKFYDGNECQFECRIFIRENGEWQGIANGHSCERRNANEMNLNSLMEIAETSALGRALAFLGLFGDNIASIEEVEKSSQKKSSVKTVKKEDNSKLISQIEQLVKNNGLDMKHIYAEYKVKSLTELSKKDLSQIYELLNINENELI